MELIDTESSRKQSGLGVKSKVNKAVESGATHEIKPKETLGGIAKQYGTTVDEMMRINPQLVDPNKIIAGQTLSLPEGTYTSQPAQHSSGGYITAYPIPQHSEVYVTKEGKVVYEDGGIGQCGEIGDKYLSLRSREFTLDPIQYILNDPDISKNGGINNQKFLDGAIAATLTTLDQGTDEGFAYALGKQSKWYKYHTIKMGIITSAIDYGINLKDQQKICPNCDSAVNHIVASVQTVAGNGVAGIGAGVGSAFGPPGAVGGAVAASTAYSASDLNKQIGELARTSTQHTVKFYYEIKNK